MSRLLTLVVTSAIFMILLASSAQAAPLEGYSFRLGTGFGKPDSNGYVPEYYRQTVGTCNDSMLAVTHYEYDASAWYGPHVMWIEYDQCEMARLQATADGWARLLAHERAHSRGFAHGEGTRKYNDAYDPIVNVR